MPSSWTLLGVVSISLVSSYCLLLVYYLTLHPLAKIPGPVANKLTGWMNMSAVLTGRRHIVMHELHQRYGPVVRFAPDMVSINTATALRDIYGPRKGNIIKSDWYRTLLAAEHGLPSTFTARDPTFHAIKRRMLSQAFSEKSMQDMEQYVSANVNKWLDKLGDERPDDRKWTAPRNVATLISYLTFDVVTDLCYGRSFDLLGKDNMRFVAKPIPGATKGIYELGYHPFNCILRRLIFDPRVGNLFAGQDVLDHKHMQEATEGFLAERRSLELYNEKSSSSARKDFFYHLFRCKDPETGRTFTNAELASESNLLVVAGADTSSTTLAACIFNLLRHPNVLKKLRAELDANFDELDHIKHTGTPLATLPYLRAVIDETLRQAPPVPAHIPRKVIGDGIIVDDVFYPPGITIGISTYALHHSEEYFPEPYAFRPERWIMDEDAGVTKEKVTLAQSAFCPFSIGPRGCVGKNLAYMELSLAVARCVWRYDMEEVVGWEENVSKDFVMLQGEYPVLDYFVAKTDGPVVRFKDRAEH